MLRLIFLILLALNLLFLAWQAWLAPADDADLVYVSAPDQGGLQLAESGSDGPPPPKDWSPAACVQLGAFEAMEDAEETARALGLLAPEVRSRLIIEPTAWWVVIPPEEVEDTDAMRRRLESAGAGDYFIIASGEGVGGVSLGLFSTPERARQRVSHLQGLGFDPLIRERLRETREYWLVLPLGLPLPAGLRADRRLEPALCPEAPELLVTDDTQPVE